MQTENTNSTCKGCGRMIIWAFNAETGKNVPLDPSAPVYELVRDVAQERVWANRSARHYVSHFITCPKANQFSGSRVKS